MTLNEIPQEAVQIQQGLWLHSYDIVIAGTVYTMRHLYASEGYCFYDITEEIYDEEGNVIPVDGILPTQRTYMRYAALSIYDVVEHYISVPVEEGFDILGNPTQPETEIA